MLLRSTEGRIYRSDSADYGETWTHTYPTELPNNSGIDLVQSSEGILYLIYNPVESNWGPRTPISLAVSEDDGKSWKKVQDLSNGEGEFSYPAIIADDDFLYITYTFKRQNIAFWKIKLLNGNDTYKWDKTVRLYYS
ncbi:MAG: exo-alpha-sialidase [Clostridiaceae bacterium]|nr:exo-alpha-sialidase [Clostridiaceae bacterium]